MCVEIKHHLEERGFNTFEINMNEHNTSRAIFMKLLECIWGFSPESIVHNSFDEIEELFHCIGAYDLVPDYIRCLQFIFSRNIQEYTGNSDIYQYILLNIVEKLFACALLKNPTSIVSKLLQPSNMPEKPVTLEVSISPVVIFVNFSQFQNIRPM